MHVASLCSSTAVEMFNYPCSPKPDPSQVMTSHGHLVGEMQMLWDLLACSCVLPLVLWAGHWCAFSSLFAHKSSNTFETPDKWHGGQVVSRIGSGQAAPCTPVILL
jgi:hypothetical protein